jgi:small subunit ribosomal protein S16
LLAIRLTRMGAKKRPFYRIIVTEKENKRDGRFLEIVGHYDPCRQPAQLDMNRDRIDYWLEKGAQPTLTVRRLINSQKRSAADTKAATA